MTLPKELVLILCIVVAVFSYDIRRHLATKTAYFAPTSSNSPPPAGCSVIHVDLLSRHGTRYPTGGTITDFNTLEKTLETVKDKITTPAYAWLKTWKNPYTTATKGLLSHRGEEELYQHGQRFKAEFAKLMNGSYKEYRFPMLTTQVPRAARSGNSFGYGLWEGTGDLGASNFQPFFQYSQTEADDRILRYFKICPNYLAKPSPDAQSDLWAERSYSSIKGDLSQKLGTGLSWNVTSDEVNMLYNACQFEASLFNVTDKFCSLFSEASADILEYYQDLFYYYKSGYGNKINYQIACPLLTSIISGMDGKASGNKDYADEDVNLRFAHAETVMPLFSLLGLFSDPQHLTADLPQKDIDNRKWRTSSISPFGANIRFELYECGTDSHRVRVLVNEKEVTVPKCELFCPLPTFKQLYNHSEGVACKFNEICGIDDNTPTDEDDYDVQTVVVVGVGSFVCGCLFVVIIACIIVRRQKDAKDYHLVSTADMGQEDMSSS